MASVHDVAAYIVEKQRPMSTWKLQKLVYYCQAWHLVWRDTPLFEDTIQAWANGPVVYSLYDRYRGLFSLSTWEGDPSRLDENEQSVADSVFAAYGQLTGRQLSHLTHSEWPWQEARMGLGPTDRSNAPISLPTMAAYYGALDTDETAQPVDSLDWNV